jgi:hypothetical protein
MRVLHKKTKDKKHTTRVLHKKVKDQKENMRALLDPMFKFARNEANFKKRQYHMQTVEVLLKDLEKNKMPRPPFHMEKEGGQRFKDHN